MFNTLFIVFFAQLAIAHFSMNAMELDDVDQNSLVPLNVNCNKKKKTVTFGTTILLKTTSDSKGKPIRQTVTKKAFDSFWPHLEKLFFSFSEERIKEAIDIDNALRKLLVGQPIQDKNIEQKLQFFKIPTKSEELTSDQKKILKASLAVGSNTSWGSNPSECHAIYVHYISSTGTPGLILFGKTNRSDNNSN